MADIKIISNTTIDVQVHLLLTEGEARALDAIVGYGPDLFVKWFYETHGKSYLKPHEDSMRSLFKTIRNELPKQLRKVDQIRKVVIEIKKLP